MITVALSTTIGAPRERVWRALVDPDERTAWDERVLGRVESRRRDTRRGRRARESDRAPGSGDPTARRGSGSAGSTDEQRADPLRRTRWRFVLGNVPMVLCEEILVASGNDRLVSRVGIGSMHFDQTLTFHAEDDEGDSRTRLGMKIVAHNSIAVIGEVVPRLDVQKLVIEYVDATLRQVQKFCESET